MQWLLDRIHAIELPGYGDDEINFMGQAMKLWQPTHVYDWGTNRGSSARIFYEASVAFQQPCVIHSTDLPPEDAWRDRDHPGEQIAFFLRETTVQTHLGDGCLSSMQLCLEEKPERALFFVDGDHSFEAVTRELASISVVCPTGVILCHDSFHIPGVKEAIANFRRTAYGSVYDELVLLSQAGMTRLWPRRSR